MSEAQLKYFNLLNLLYQCSFGRLQPSRGHVQSLLEWNVDSKNCDSMIDKLIYDRYVKEEGETITITELGIEIFKGMQLDLERERINALEIKTEERDKIVFFLTWILAVSSAITALYYLTKGFLWFYSCHCR